MKDFAAGSAITDLEHAEEPTLKLVIHTSYTGRSKVILSTLSTRRLLVLRSWMATGMRTPLAIVTVVITIVTAGAEIAAGVSFVN